MIIRLLKIHYHSNTVQVGGVIAILDTQVIPENPLNVTDNLRWSIIGRFV